jgi:hypothetical protein
VDHDGRKDEASAIVLNSQLGMFKVSRRMATYPQSMVISISSTKEDLLPLVDWIFTVQACSSSASLEFWQKS